MRISLLRGFGGPGSTAVLAVSLLLTGCGSGLAPAVYSDATSITGNWQLSSTAAAASRLPSLSGQLTGSDPQVTGVFHSNSSAACVSPGTPIAVSGFAGANNLVTLTGALAGGTLTISGTLAADGRTLTASSYNVSGGICAFPGPAEATTAQSYSPIEGTYVGTFTNVTGHTIEFNIDLSQSLTADANGNFPLSGSSTLANNVCYSGLINIANALVTGESFTFTYTDPNQGNSTVVDGTLSTDASTLTVTNWSLTGPCNTTSGTGTLVRQ